MDVATIAPEKQARLIELDSLRGVACMAVLISHFLKVWFSDTNAEYINGNLWSLLSVLGDAAVFLFFILSGFVLALPWVEGKPQSYFTFVTRRIFRIYIPYLAALALAVAGDYWLHGAVSNNAYLQQFWSEPVNWHLVRQHVLFVGIFNSDQFDAPIWSLVYEMRISLIFPLLCVVALRFSKAWLFAMPVGMVAISIVARRLNPSIDQWDVVNTICYSALFILGIWLVREKARIAVWFASLSRRVQVFIGVASVLLFTIAGPEFSKFTVWLIHLELGAVAHWIPALGGAGLIVLSLNSASCKRILHWAPIRALGKMSYSFYLLHFVFMLYLVHLFYGKISMAAVLAVAFGLSLAISWCFYRFIELPSINLGRRLSRISVRR